MFNIALTLWFWFGLAAAFIILDVVLGASFFLLWLGVVALVVGSVLWVVPNLVAEFQFLIFAVGSLISIALWRRYLKDHSGKSDKPGLNRRSEQYIGRTFTLSDPIINGRGKIHAEDSWWQVEGPDLPAGTKVRVIGVDGILLKVKAVE